ncbi:hypothetical protein ABZX40_40235 [Streptomyces sp. NPDC004610]|uniref:hypothetical protein n=1 Tax=unclassified Streptomyces TaxID=2593676 RepID=UPI0033B28A47
MAASGTSALDPTPPAHTPLSRAGRFIWLTARVLEQRLFAYHFLGGDADPVETALDAHRNADGGYGHALEPDLRGPVSEPLHAVHALRVLDAVGRCGGQRVERLCRYLTGVSTPEGALPVVHAGRRGVPGAPFLPAVADPPSELLTTGPVVGVLRRNDVWHAWLFRATDFCWTAVDSLERSHPYEIQAALAFLESAPDRPRARAAADRLGRLVRDRRLVVLDPERPEAFAPAAGYGPGYAPKGHHYPHDYAPGTHSLARGWFTDDEMARSLDFLAAAQREDGGWPAHRPHWAAVPTAEARPMVTIEALRTLRAYGHGVG